MINKKEITEKLLDRFKSPGWYNILQDFFLSNIGLFDYTRFDTILDYLEEEVNKGKLFTPSLSKVFSCFEKCNYNALKVVTIAEAPYFQSGVADGLAFSCSHTKILQPSLKLILEEVATTVYQGEVYNYDPDLTRWANQGVLLFNTALTSQVGLAQTHFSIWKEFTTYILTKLNEQNSGLIFLFAGRVAQSFGHLIDDKNHCKFNVYHPAYSSRMNIPWDSGYFFNKTNKLLWENNKTKIIW